MNNGISKRKFYGHIFIAWFASVLATNIMDERFHLKRTAYHADGALTCVALATILLIFPLAVLLRKFIPFNSAMLFILDLLILVPLPAVVYVNGI